MKGTTNAVKLINRQSVPQNAKLVSLKPLIEHFYLEDKRQVIQSSKRRRTRRLPKPPESQALLYPIPKGRKAIGAAVSVEFYNEDDDCSTRTKW